MEATLYAIDNSSSTSGVIKYWDKVKSVIINSDENDKFVLWNSSTEIVNKGKVMKTCETRTGTGGTSPACFVKHLDNVTKLVIISDGQISSYDVKATDEALKAKNYDLKIKEVEAYFVNTGWTVDTSVVIPFSRNAKYEIHNDEDVLQGNNKDFDIKPFYDPMYYEKNFPTLRQYVAMKTLSREDGTLRNELLNLKNALIKKLTLAKDNSKPDEITDVINKDLDEAYNKTRLFVSSSNTDLLKKIESDIMELCELCKSSDFSFDNIRSSRLARTSVISKPQPMEELETDNNYECPILLSGDFPCLLINEGEPILSGEERVDDLITQPLYFLKRDHLVEKLYARLDSVIGVSALSKLSPLISPFTRSKLLGGLSTGTHESHVKSNVWTLARLLFGRKICGSVDLWMSVIYFAIKNNEVYNERFKEFVSGIEQYLKQRFDTVYTTLSLSGLPDFPLMKVKFKLALWYVVSSPIIMKDNIEQDRLRGLIGVEDYLMGLLDLTGLKYEKEFLVERVKYYRCFSLLMKGAKSEIKREKEKFHGSVRALYQNHIKYEESYVFLDGPYTGEVKVPFDIPLDKYLYLYSLINISKTTNEIPIPFELGSVKPTVAYNYNYKSIDKEYIVPICPATYRPWLNDVTSGIPWKESAESVYGLDPKKQLSTRELFYCYVIKYNKFPTKKELLIFCYDRQRMKENPLDTLPIKAEEYIDQCFSEFAKVGIYTPDFEGEKICEEVSVAKYLKVSTHCMNMNVRKKEEDIYKKKM